MQFRIKIHYDNTAGFQIPHLWAWYGGSSIQDDFEPTRKDGFGFVYDVAVARSQLSFKFKEGPGTFGPWEEEILNREYRPVMMDSGVIAPGEIWCKGNKAFVYTVEPREPEPESAENFIRRLSFKQGIYVPDTGCFRGLGAARAAGYAEDIRQNSIFVSYEYAGVSARVFSPYE